MPTITTDQSPISKPTALKKAVRDLAVANNLYQPNVKVLCQYNAGVYTASLRLYYREGYSGRPTFKAVKVIHNTIPATPSSNVCYAYTFEDSKVLDILREFTAKAAAYQARVLAESAARGRKSSKLEALLQEAFGADADISGATNGDVGLTVGTLYASVSLRPEFASGVAVDDATVADLRFQVGAGGYRSGLRNLTVDAFKAIANVIAGEVAAGRLTEQDVDL